jgi:4-carboxymuconolactone decarboxylase
MDSGPKDGAAGAGAGADATRTGEAIRREIFGADVTDRQLEQSNRFTRPMQDVVSRYCFGETWSRDGLTRRERSLATLAVLCALGRSHELRIHVQGAISNGATPLEIREVLLHAMVYCGVPLGVDAIRNAAEVLAGLGIDLEGDLQAPAGTARAAGAR